jgi:patatin-related protein
MTGTLHPETTAAPAGRSTPPFEPTQEVRFAVVMYGGISLAIYINGIVQELLRLVRATAPERPWGDNPSRALRADAELSGTERVYRKLGQMLDAGSVTSEQPRPDDPIRTRFVVDVLSGTSAGGINAVFLGKALANEQDLGGIKQLWIDEADIDLLVNDERSRTRAAHRLDLERPPESVLNSRRMYYELLTALCGMNATAPQAESRFVDELDCWITATDIRGVELPINLYDEVVPESRHRSVFRFVYRSPHASDGEQTNDFAAEYDPFLAFAARATASFPFAFEPMELADIDAATALSPPIAHSATPAQDSTSAAFERFYRDYLSLDDGATAFRERPFADGGILDNKPFSWATDHLARRRADLPVDRRLIYLEPDPELPALRQGTAQRRPNALENVRGALLELPQAEPIREDIRRVIERNAEIDRVRGVASLADHALRMAGTATPWKSLSTEDWRSSTLTSLIQARGLMWLSYHALRVATVLDDLAELVGRIRGFEQDSDTFRATRLVIQAWFEGAYETETKPSGAHQTEFLFQFDLAFRLRRLKFVDGQIERLLTKSDDELAAELPAAAGRQEEVRTYLRALKPVLSEAATRLRAAGRDLRSAAGTGNLGRALSGAALGFTGAELTREILCPRTRGKELEAAGEFLGTRGLETKLTEAARLVAERLGKPMDEAGRAVEDAIGGDTASPAEQAARELVKRYYNCFDYYDSALFPLSYGVVGETDRVEVVRVSPAYRTKLGGVRLHHFGGFFQRPWRLNDMMWGRLDAAERLIATLLPAGHASAAGLIEEAQLAIVREERAAVFPDSELSDDDLLTHLKSDYTVDELPIDRAGLVRIAGRGLDVTGDMLGGLSARAGGLRAVTLLLGKLAVRFLRFSVLPAGVLVAVALAVLAGLAALVVCGAVFGSSPAARVGWTLGSYAVVAAGLVWRARKLVEGAVSTDPPPPARHGGMVRNIALALAAAVLLLFFPLALLNDGVSDFAGFLPGWS